MRKLFFCVQQLDLKLRNLKVVVAFAFSHDALCLFVYLFIWRTGFQVAQDGLEFSMTQKIISYFWVSIPPPWVLDDGYVPSCLVYEVLWLEPMTLYVRGKSSIIARIVHCILQCQGFALTSMPRMVFLHLIAALLGDRSCVSSCVTGEAETQEVCLLSVTVNTLSNLPSSGMDENNPSWPSSWFGSPLGQG